MKKNEEEKKYCTTTDDLGSSSIDDFHFGTSEIQILLRFMKYISSNSALVLSVALLVSVAHRKEENTGLVNKVPFKYNNGDTNSAWQAEKKKLTDKVKSKLVFSLG